MLKDECLREATDYTIDSVKSHGRFPLLEIQKYKVKGWGRCHKNWSH